MNIDDRQIAALIANLDHHDKPTIRAAVDALIPLATASLQLREFLDQRLTANGHKNYWPVAYILGHLNRPSSACIANLLDTLDHPEPDIRWAMALLLQHIAKDEHNVVKLLIELCSSGTAKQKRMALYCLRDLALSDSVTVSTLLKALRDTDPTVRVSAAICLKRRADLDDSGKKLLLQVYANDADAKVRNTVAIALADLGSPSAEFLIALNKNRDSNDGQTKKAAIAALTLLEKRRSASSDSRSGR
ncbi:MAG: HEAT repeat domain-containing protein [Candidatus Binatia bacterium]